MLKLLRNLSIIIITSVIRNELTNDKPIKLMIKDLNSNSKSTYRSRLSLK